MRNATNVADAITALKAVVSEQATALAEVKAALATKAIGSGASLFGVICDGSTLYPVSGVTVSEADGVITLGG